MCRPDERILPAETVRVVSGERLVLAANLLGRNGKALVKNDGTNNRLTGIRPGLILSWEHGTSARWLT